MRSAMFLGPGCEARTIPVIRTRKTSIGRQETAAGSRRRPACGPAEGVVFGQMPNFHAKPVRHTDRCRIRLPTCRQFPAPGIRLSALTPGGIRARTCESLANIDRVPIRNTTRPEIV